MEVAEDLLLVVLHSHIIAAAKAILSDAEASYYVASLAKSIVDSCVNLTVLSSDYAPNTSIDKMFMYAKEVLTLGLLWHNFHYSIKKEMETIFSRALFGI